MKGKSILYIIILFGALIQVPFYVMAQGNTATIYVMRKQMIGTPFKPSISINDIELGQLPNKKYIECTVPSGKVSVSAYSSMSKDAQDINFRVESGKVYYVKVNVDFNGVGGVNFSHNNGANMMQTNSAGVDFKLKISRMMDNEGEKLRKKCKQELFADISDMMPQNNSSYAYQESESYSEKPTVETPVSVKKSVVSDVDKNIPITGADNKNTYVLIIANEDYAFVDDVEFALNDGRIFKEYCVKTLGIPERQIWLYENASMGIMSSGVNKMVQAMNLFKDSQAIIYYCGHGIPDEKSRDAYIVPVDGKGTDVSSCYSLKKLYDTINQTNAKNVTYFMDACFTGAKRDGSMLVAARGVAREPKKETLLGNTIVFSAASGDETALPYKEKGHGLFTYFLLKKLQDSKGNVTYGELADYINDNVKREAFLTNEKPQNPVVLTSTELSDKWYKIKIK